MVFLLYLLVSHTSSIATTLPRSEYLNKLLFINKFLLMKNQKWKAWGWLSLQSEMGISLCIRGDGGIVERG
jgi:hypothetical protein